MSPTRFPWPNYVNVEIKLRSDVKKKSTPTEGGLPLPTRFYGAIKVFIDRLDSGISMDRESVLEVGCSVKIVSKKELTFQIRFPKVNLNQ